MSTSHVWPTRRRAQNMNTVMHSIDARTEFPVSEVCTLPSLRAHTREALVVFRLLAYTSILTRFRAARGQQGLTVLT